MKLGTLGLPVLWISCLLLGAWGRPFPQEKLWSLDLARNRELFLSALQSYFSDKGLHVDRNAPDFFAYPDKSQQAHAALLSARDFREDQ